MQIVPEEGRAMVLSSDAGLSGLAGAVAPFMGTTLWHIVGFKFFGLTSACLMAATVLLVHAGFLAG